MRHRSFSRRNVCTPIRLVMSQTRIDRSSELEMISSLLGWKMTQDTLLVCPRSVSTSQAFVSESRFGMDRPRPINSVISRRILCDGESGVLTVHAPKLHLAIISTRDHKW